MIIVADIKVIIEIDGSIHELPEQILKDAKKDKFYKSSGYEVIRIKAYNDDSFWEGIKKLEQRIKDMQIPYIKYNTQKKIKQYKSILDKPFKNKYIVRKKKS